MPYVNNKNTLMTDTGTGQGKNKFVTPVMGTDANGNKKLPKAQHLNTNSPLYKEPLPDAEITDPKPETDTNKGSGGGGGGGGSNYSRYRSYASGGSGGGVATADPGVNLAALAAALQAQKQARIDAINAANAALDKQAEAMRGKYDQSLATLGADYQKLRNQAEVNRYRAMYNQREALANRGALGSGAGRQENMTLSNNYNNNLNAISLQEAAERQNIQNAINEMYANVEQQKAQNMTNGLSDYSAALQNLINAQYSGYSPDTSTYYQQALQALGANSGANDSNYMAYLRALGYNV